MEAKNKLIDIIRDWVKTDNEMRTLKSELSTRKKGKDALSAELMNIMKEEEIDSVDINDGRIEYASRKTKKPITKKLLLNILSTYYTGDTSIARDGNTFRVRNRVGVVNDSMVRKADK